MQTGEGWAPSTPIIMETIMPLSREPPKPWSPTAHTSLTPTDPSLPSTSNLDMPSASMSPTSLRSSSTRFCWGSKKSAPSLTSPTNWRAGWRWLGWWAWRTLSGQAWGRQWVNAERPVCRWGWRRGTAGASPSAWPNKQAFWMTDGKTQRDSAVCYQGRNSGSWSKNLKRTTCTTSDRLPHTFVLWVSVLKSISICLPLD